MRRIRDKVFLVSKIIPSTLRGKPREGASGLLHATQRTVRHAENRLVSTDPTSALRGALTAPVVQHRAAIIDPAPFGALLRAIDGYDGTLVVRSALQLLALTFTRPGELRLATWKEFELDADVWTIPANRMKMRRPHRIPLAPQTIAILEELRMLTGRYELLFSGVRSPSRPLSENTLNAALRRLGYAKNEMSSHGFRAAASSFLNECGKWNADAIEVQLAHVEANAVRKAYARAEYWEERVEMTEPLSPDGAGLLLISGSTVRANVHPPQKIKQL